MKSQSPVTSHQLIAWAQPCTRHQSFRGLLALVSLAFVTLTLGSSALELSNKYVKVKIDTPNDISQFTGIKIREDFYFIGKAESPTTEFNVTYEISLTEEATQAKCVLVAPTPSTNTKKTNGGLVTSYKVEYEVKGEKKTGGNVYFLPVEIKVNETAKEEDDFVAVSKGVDDDLATDFSVKLTGTDGITAELSVKAGDGDIKFKDEELALVSGTEVKTKLWGITPGSAKDTTIIEVSLTKESKELVKIEENVTVFEIKISEAIVASDSFGVKDDLIKQLITLKPRIDHSAIELDAGWSVKVNEQNTFNGGMKVMRKMVLGSFMQADIARWSEHCHFPVDHAHRLARYIELLGQPPANHLNDDGILNDGGNIELRKRINELREWKDTSGSIDLKVTLHVFTEEDYANIEWDDRRFKTGSLETYAGELIPNRIRALNDHDPGQWTADLSIRNNAISKGVDESSYKW